jgi:hypothetical protein
MLPELLDLAVVLLDLLLVDLRLLDHVLLEGEPLLHEPVVLLLLQLPLLHPLDLLVTLAGLELAVLLHRCQDLLVRLHRVGSTRFERRSF